MANHDSWRKLQTPIVAEAAKNQLIKSIIEL